MRKLQEEKGCVAATTTVVSGDKHNSNESKGSGNGTAILLNITNC